MTTKLEEFLKDWNRKVADQKQEVLLNAAGYNTAGEQAGFWHRYKTIIGVDAFLIISAVLCYMYGFVLVARILGLVLLLQLGSLLWKGIKKLYSIGKDYWIEKKLSRQA